MSQAIKPSFHVFQDIDGQPLENGYIYVGTAGLAAATNQIQVYWDSALTIPATQPIRTISGYPMRSGSPSMFFVSENDYSLQVSDRNNSSIYAKLSGNAETSDSIAFNSTVSRTVSDKLNDFVSVKDYGALGDGITDDSDSIEDAIRSGNCIYFPKGTYIVSRLITTTTVNDPFIIKGAGRDLSFIKSSSSAFTFRAGFIVDISDIAIIGHTSNQDNATASGYDMLSATAHQWKLNNVLFQNLICAFKTSQAWVGQANNIYVHDCGDASTYAISLTNATNAVHFNNLQIRGSMGGTSSGTTGKWEGKGLYVGDGTGTECYDVQFNNLGIEAISVLDAATFDNKVTIIGGYWEVLDAPNASYMNVSFNDAANIIGGFLNCKINISDPDIVNFIGCKIAYDPPITGNLIGCTDVDSRSVLNLTTNGPSIPINLRSNTCKAREAALGNFETNLTTGVADYGAGEHTVSVVSDGYFNTKSMKMEITSTPTYLGGALGLPYAKKPATRADVYAWAIVKSNSANQVVLSLGGDAQQNPGDTLFTALTPNEWHFMQLGPIQPSYDSTLWVRLLGNAGGNPTVGSTLIVDSWGVSFGGIDLTNIYKDF